MIITHDWFSNNIHLWKRNLKHFIGKPIKALEIGSYEGLSASWLLDNILTHRDARMVCIDNFSEGTFTTFSKNMSKYKSKIKVMKGDSSVMLKSPKILKDKFDIIYIDADHHSRHVIEDAILSFSLLNTNGIMIFDDNTDSKEHDNTCPKPAISAFIQLYADELKVIHNGWQVIIRKITPKKTRACRSEFY